MEKTIFTVLAAIGGWSALVMSFKGIDKPGGLLQFAWLCISGFLLSHVMLNLEYAPISDLIRLFAFGSAGLCCAFLCARREAGPFTELGIMQRVLFLVFPSIGVIANVCDQILGSHLSPFVLLFQLIASLGAFSRGKVSFYLASKGFTMKFSRISLLEYCMLGIPLSVLFQSFSLPALSTASIYAIAIAMSFANIRIQNAKVMNPKKAPSRSYISGLDIQQIDDHLDILLKIKKLYREEDISLPKLAEGLAITTHQLSQFINKRKGMNFFAYINGFRISEAKQLLCEDRGRTIMSIAYFVGFNSHASFNRVFKQSLGITPLAYRQIHLKSKEASHAIEQSQDVGRLGNHILPA